MKCPKCVVGRTLYQPKDGGKAYIGDCDRCHGTGEIEVTNEEYIRSCTTEQLAEFLADTINEIIDGIAYEMKEGVFDQDDFYQTKHCWMEWLKQPHTKE